MADPGTMLDILKRAAIATTAVYRAIDKALELEFEGQRSLKDLSKAVVSLKSDTAVYKILLNSMENDTNSDINSGSPYTLFIQRWVTVIVNFIFAQS